MDMKFWLIALLTMLSVYPTYGQSNPEAYKLSGSPFYFTNWPSSSEAETFPTGMVLQQYDDEDDPNKNSEPISDWICNYNLESKSRFVGLGNSGIGFLNTGSNLSRTECNGANAGKVGVVTLAINTSDIENIELSWRVRMIKQGDGFPLPREYRITAQYRLDSSSAWMDFPATSRYSSFNKNEGSIKNFSLQLPNTFDNKEYVQFRWKYYQESSNQGGTRPFLALDDIKVIGEKSDGNNTPVLFTDQTTIGSFGCVEGNFSQIDSILFSANFLKENLSIESDGEFYISLSENENYNQSILIQAPNGKIGDTYLYIKKKCSSIGEKKGILSFISGSLKKNFALSGEGYYKVFINELVASNFKSYDEREIYPDWIELYNPNDTGFSIAGYYMSDDINNLTKHRLRGPESFMESYGFNLFFADDSRTTDKYLQFKLSNSGESVFLVGKDGKTIIDSVTFGYQKTDISYGREIDGSDKWVQFKEPTPDKSNNNGVIRFENQADPPIFSANGGKYEYPFVLSLSSPHPDAKIYYTIDGSEPSIDNLGGSVFEYKQSYYLEPGHITESYFQPYRTIFYFEPIELSLYKDKPYKISNISTTYTIAPYIPKINRNNAVIIRAIAVQPNMEASEIITQSYFFSNGDPTKDSLPIISLALNPHQYLSFEDGIAVPGKDYEDWRFSTPIQQNTNFLRPANFNRRGRPAEIASNLEIFEKNKPYFNEKIGIRIHGNSSRAKRSKNMRIYSRSLYGNEKIVFPFFDNLPYEDYKRILLRLSSERKTRFIDMFVQQITKSLNVDYQEYNPYVLYINGEYWGIANALERIDKNYLQRKYGFDDSNFDMLEKEGRIKQGSNADYLQFIQNLDSINISSDEGYNWLYSKMDVENFITYFPFRIYTSDMDWPLNNIIYWKYNSVTKNNRTPYGLDGKWRWIHFDNDGAFRVDPSYNSLNDLFKEFYIIKNGDGEDVFYDNWSTTLFRALMKNDRIKIQFITRFSDMINTVYKVERVLNLLGNIKNLYEPDIENQIARWEYPSTLSNWYSNIEIVKNFVTQRPNYCFENMKESFHLGSTDSVFIDVNDFSMGYLKINTMEINEKTPGVDTAQVYPWGGRYFKNLPVTLIPLPRDEYRFAYWEIDGKKTATDSDTLIFDLSKRTSIKAYFEVDPNYIYNPEAVKIDVCPYEFAEWNKKQEIGTYPGNMAFYYTRYPDSRANGALEGIMDSILYDYSSKTRINGLGAKGLSLINTATANDYYYQTRLGAVGVAFNTIDIPGATVQFTVGTVKPQSKQYGIRLQYRFSDKGEVFDLKDKNGNIVEYIANDFADHQQTFKIELPQDFMGRKYVQLLWRYYFTGVQRFEDSKQRDELRIDDIIIKQNEIAGTESKEMYKKTLNGNPHGIAYQWYQCEDDSLKLLEGQTNRDLTITQPGWYALSVDYGDCQFISDCQEFYVKEHKDFYPSIHTTIIPNPSKGIFDLVFDETMKDISISIVDLTGKIVHTRFEKEARQIKYNLKNLASGVYVLDINTKDGKQATEKIVIQ
ncbi:MAG: CotH kinase family protein [Chitinophagales bacterium]|nr:CotH kinase family protein [Chitinophagales bacterium]